MFNKHWREILIALLIIVIIFLLQNPRTETVRVPVEVEVEAPGASGISDTIFLKDHDTLVVRDTIYKERTKFVSHGPDLTLRQQYLKAKDSIDKLNLYISSIQIRSYNLDFKDSIQDVTVYTKTRGSILEQSIKYDIHDRVVKKETEVEVEIPAQNKFFGLLELGRPVLIPEESPGIHGKATGIFKNKKDNLLSASVDTRGWVWAGYGFRFNF